ncbi:ABC transporter ATP-binding protein [Stackebrandtia nassauensis]|uniref:ABC transporter related protein n=1 Tax=Stackebrandtia nassauensis (strain DSM 44728 / CIP 108903 / NRRL B-16338 / NBRC 102104 / LLR-40K-21) TaxID=446470 RepID=D3Q4H6_STANL|nr:ABC transporter ATP-binding protein [Stackebrandtia nassauensis]ADD40136.1 ABC transporter related protein [Stackebrandtia nassauensis DSM 44728]
MSPLPPHADPGTPDARSPGRYLWWLLWKQPSRVFLGAFWGIVSSVGIASLPFFMGKAVDEGLRARALEPLAWWTAGLILVGGVNAAANILRHRTMTHVRMDASLRTVQVVNRHAARLGSVLARRVSTGEIVAIGASDAKQVSHAMTSAGPGVGSVVACVLIAVMVLSISPLLGALVLVGVPAIVLSIGPLTKRLQRTESTYREHTGVLTARAGDIAAGLRVLRGIGGESLFASRYRRRSGELLSEGYRVGAVASWIHALGSGLPGLFLALVTWLAARLVAAGQISFGDMVAVYGYAAALVLPVAFFIEAIFDITRGRVAARRIIGVLNLEPAVTDPAEAVAGPVGPAELYDPESGLRVPARRLAAVATADAESAALIVERIARYTDSDAAYGGVPLSDMALAEVRRRILLSGNDSHLFAGTLRDMVSPSGDIDDATIGTAVRQAAATDIVEALPDGLDTEIDAQARTLSGGQRQRVRLVRALLAEPEVLILPEPTSAVDAHSEAAIAEGLREHRRDRTTLVLSTSPLVLDRCDEVAFVEDGKVTATGTHARLLNTEPGYRALVLRGAEEEGETP